MSKVRRFKTNPVEIVIFSVVSLIFINSLYNLFYDHQGFHPAALSPMAANPTSEGRAPASVVQKSFKSVDLSCESNPEQDTTATKVRLAGPLCEIDAALDAAKLLRTTIINTANQFNATVFPDVSTGKFSTDYIPLNTGKNPIH
ncbi:MAG: hypothetical protein ACXVBW_14305, partial [Bdellovibrionota bacterium]